MAGKECDHAEHVKMCKLADDKNLKKIQKLTQHPHYICKKCARVADCRENLCKPVEFSV